VWGLDQVLELPVGNPNRRFSGNELKLILLWLSYLHFVSLGKWLQTTLATSYRGFGHPGFGERPINDPIVKFSYS